MEVGVAVHELQISLKIARPTATTTEVRRSLMHHGADLRANQSVRPRSAERESCFLLPPSTSLNERLNLGPLRPRERTRHFKLFTQTVKKDALRVLLSLCSVPVRGTSQLFRRRCCHE